MNVLFGNLTPFKALVFFELIFFGNTLRFLYLISGGPPGLIAATAARTVADSPVITKNFREKEIVKN